MKIKSIRVDAVDVNEADRRDINRDFVQDLAKDIARQGLLQPIIVRPNGRRYDLVAGAHRLEAHRLLDREEIPAHVGDYETAEDAEMAELAENMFRFERTVAERAADLVRYEELLDAKGLRAKRGHGNPDEAKQTKDIAEEHGVSERTVYRLKEIGTKVPAKVLQVLDEQGWGDSTTVLTAMAKVDRELQMPIAKVVASGEKMSARQVVNMITDMARAQKATKTVKATPGKAQFFRGDFAVGLKAYERGTIDVVVTTATRHERKEVFSSLASQVRRLLSDDGLAIYVLQPESLESAWPLLTKDLHVQSVHFIEFREPKEGSKWSPVIILGRDKVWIEPRKFMMNHRANDLYRTWADQLFAVHNVEGKTVLDPMCRRGAFVTAAAKAGANAIGIDMDEFCIEAAQENARREGVA